MDAQHLLNLSTLICEQIDHLLEIHDVQVSDNPADHSCSSINRDGQECNKHDPNESCHPIRQMLAENIPGDMILLS